MSKYKSIVISGPIASGTTTAAKAVAEKLGIKYLSAGEVFRKYALDNNIPLPNKELIPDEFEYEVDNRMKSLARKGGVALDGHYAGYLLRDNSAILRILLTCDREMRIQRALKRDQKETRKDVIEREEGLDLKFRRIYVNENYLNPKFFDLEIDTTNSSIEETAKQIAEKFQKG